MRILKRIGLMTVGVTTVIGLPALAQSKQIDCSKGQAVISSNNTAVKISGDCKHVNVSGNGNTITANKIENLSFMGNANTVSAQDVGDVKAGGDNNTLRYGGDEPKHWFGGDGNKLVRGATQTAAKSETSRRPTPKRTKPNKAKPNPAPSAHSSTASKLPKNIDSMWFIYNSDNGKKWAAMTFKDGTLTTDVTTVYKQGVAASKRKNPNAWGTYTKTNGGEQLHAKFRKWKKARKYFISDKSIKMNSNFKLKGCWSSSSSSNMGVMGGAGSSSTFSTNTFCFDPNGRFSNDSAMAIGSTSSSGRSLGTSTKANHGTYRINGNSITLNYVDGRKVETVFGSYRFDTKNVFAISIGKRIYH